MSCRNKCIALGFGDNIDYEIVWDSKIFERLILDYDIREKELCTDTPISSIRDLIISILGFLKSGKGGERFVSSQEIINNFATLFKNKVTVGGTAARAAIAMRKLGYLPVLHLVTINDTIRSLIPPDIKWVCSNDHDSCYPHLIVQYEKDTVVKAGDIAIQTKLPNRIIYDNDEDNIAMRLNMEFGSLINDIPVLLISGFNAMQNIKLLDARLEMLCKIIQNLPHDAIIYYEDAGFHYPAFREQILKRLIGKIHIYSLNEDELQDILRRDISLLNAPDVYNALQRLHELTHIPIIVVHTRYWALAYGRHAQQFATALKGGITMATTRLRFGDNFTADSYYETEHLPTEEKGELFAAEIETLGGDCVCCLPSIKVDETKVTTIGLGDAFVGGFLPALSPSQKIIL